MDLKVSHFIKLLWRTHVFFMPRNVFLFFYLFEEILGHGFRAKILPVTFGFYFFALNME